eukprot:980393-Pleurochrysis_carterae.AAC.1
MAARQGAADGAKQARGKGERAGEKIDVHSEGSDGTFSATGMRSMPSLLRVAHVRREFTPSFAS